MMLDSFAGNADALQDFRGLWNRYTALKSELETVTSAIEKSLSEQEYNSSVLHHLEDARLVPGELEDLESEQKKLANAEDIKSSLCSVESEFSGDGGDGARSLSASLKSVQRSLEKLTPFVPEASALASRIESSRLELDDIYSEVTEINSSVDVSPERLQAVDDRISLLYGLMHRHSCGSVDELIALRESLSVSVAGVSGLQERKEAVEKEMACVMSELQSRSEALHSVREKAASALADAIMEKLHFLELPFSVFRIDLLPADMSPTGGDSVVFRFSSSGKEPVEVAKCASGGEMSRIMLSLKAVMSRFYKMPTMIFDEIDTGVSGSVADKMGALICEMGKYMQVFAITHLPQVAAKGSAHYLVSKTVDPVSSKAETTIKKLSDEQRVLEVARMLSGSVLTDAAIANAKDLLKG